MNLRSTRLCGLLAAALFSLTTSLGFSAEPAGTVYNPKSGLLAGWSAIVSAKQEGGVSLLITPTALAKPYAGLQIVAGSGAGIPLTDALRAGGEVHLFLRNGNDAVGKPAADQMLQAMLAFQPEGGKVLNGQYEQIALDPTPAGGKASAGWQLVKLSIAKNLQGRVDAATPLKLCGVYVQYIDQPQAAYFVGECTVVAPAAK